ncbi:MAG: extracellular solute-binding protein, partial [Deltaproteobacteria bacterium]|nr:extracellular solute-binding protein [Deltaproteobacteria bacterium]
TVPYSWGTTGIAVNRAKVKAKVDSWAWLFEHPELAGQLTMLDDAPAVVGSALKFLGYAYNESSPEAFAKVKALLTRQKKALKAYTPEAQPVLESGEVAIAQAYSGDVIQVRTRKNPNIEYVLPKEGGEIFGARADEIRRRAAASVESGGFPHRRAAQKVRDDAGEPPAHRADPEALDRAQVLLNRAVLSKK